LNGKRRTIGSKKRRTNPRDFLFFHATVRSYAIDRSFVSGSARCAKFVSGSGTRRDLPYYELPEEVRAVVEDSPKLECCEEFRDADIFSFVKHLKERRCKQCMACLRQMDEELRTMVLLTEIKKRNVR
jgi:hypothetical protein